MDMEKQSHCLIMMTTITLLMKSIYLVRIQIKQNINFLLKA